MQQNLTSSILENAAIEFATLKDVRSANRFSKLCSETSSNLLLSDLKVHVLRRLGTTISSLFDAYDGIESLNNPSLSIGVSAGTFVLNSLILCVHAQQLSHQSQIQLMKQQVAMPGELDSGHAGDTVVLKELFSLLVKLTSRAILLTSISIQVAEAVGKELVDSDSASGVILSSANLTIASAAASAICSSTLSMLLTGFSHIPSCFRRVAPDVVLLCGKLSTTSAYITSNGINTSTPSLVISKLSLHCLVLAISSSVRASKSVSSSHLSSGEETGKVTPFGSPSYNGERVLDLDVFIRWLISAIDTHFFQLHRIAAYADVDIMSDVQAWEGLVALLPRDGTSFAKPQDKLVDQLNESSSSSSSRVQNETNGDNSSLCLLVTSRMISYCSLLTLLASGGQQKTRLLSASPALPLCESISLPISAVMALVERLLDSGAGLISGIHSLQPTLAETALVEGKWKRCLESLICSLIRTALSLIMSISMSTPQVLVHFRTHVSRLLLRTLMLLAPPLSGGQSPIQQQQQRSLFPPSDDFKRKELFVLVIQTSRSWVLSGGLGTMPSSLSFSSPEAYALLLLLSSIAAQGIRRWSTLLSASLSSSSSSLMLSLRDSLQLAEACVLFGWSSLPVGRRFLIEQAVLSLFADAWPGGALSIQKLGGLTTSRGQSTSTNIASASSGALKRSREYLLKQQQQQGKEETLGQTLSYVATISQMKDVSRVALALDFGIVSSGGFSTGLKNSTSHCSNSSSFLVPPSFAAAHAAQSQNGSFSELSTGLALDPETRSNAFLLLSTCIATRWKNGATTPFLPLLQAVLLSASGAGHSLGSSASIVNAATASQILLQTLPFPLHEVLEAEKEAFESDSVACNADMTSSKVDEIEKVSSTATSLKLDHISIPPLSSVTITPFSETLNELKPKWSPPPPALLSSSILLASSSMSDISTKDSIVMAKYATDYANEFPDIN